MIRRFFRWLFGRRNEWTNGMDGTRYKPFMTYSDGSTLYEREHSDYLYVMIPPPKQGRSPALIKPFFVRTAINRNGSTAMDSEAYPGQCGQLLTAFGSMEPASRPPSYSSALP